MDIEELFKPNVTEDFVKDLVRRLYGLNVLSIKNMVSYDDQNFHIKVSKEYQNPHISNTCSEGYTLKITNTLKSSAVGNFDAMHFVMCYLDKKEVRAPLPVRNLAGKTWTVEAVPVKNGGESSSGRCGIQLLTFIPGVPVSTVEYTRDILFQWGQLLAKYHKATKDVDYPFLYKKEVFWSLSQIPDLEKFIGILDDPKKKLVRNVLKKYPSEITQNINNLPKGFIHGDFNENNILVEVNSINEQEKSYNVNGVLDFEDIHYGTYVWDLGVLLAYTLLECNAMDPLEGAGHALAGFLSLRSLNELEFSLIKICIESRLCQSLVLGAFSASKDPKNTYLLSSAKSGWTRLEHICSVSNEYLLQKWKEIRETYNTNNE